MGTQTSCDGTFNKKHICTASDLYDIWKERLKNKTPPLTRHKGSRHSH